MKKKISKIKNSKGKKKIVCLTAYSKPIAKILDKYCDIILVGDSVATAFYGMNSTRDLSVDTLLNHAKSVKRGVKKSLLVIDMPHNSYRNFKEAKKNAKNFLKKTKCDAVKIESNGKNFKIIEKLVKSKIPVMGHIGYTPQFKKRFKIQGSSLKEEKKLTYEASRIEKAGAFSIVLECISSKVAMKITNLVRVPTIGIGSSKNCDGQILVTDDLIGLSGFYPKFVKKYLDLQKHLSRAIKNFTKDVKSNTFPTKSNTY